ncbi:MAG TPA: MarR family transcriptional regulator [Candidatus Kaiserbacteria bacterium]|nr:MarR family transcriptional regulator [Candidatus Kaiserbacteria bacterium]
MKNSKKHSSKDIARALSGFFAVKGRIRTQMTQGMKVNPSTWLRLETLKFIEDNKVPRVKDVADYFSITAPSATSLVAGLVRSGLVKRNNDANDRRVARLVLTAKGKRTLYSTMKRGTALLATFFEELSTRELEQFVGFLERLNNVTSLRNSARIKNKNNNLL